MATKKQQKEEIAVKTPENVVLGISAREDVNAKVTMPEFFHLMKTVDALVNLMAHLKQVNIQEDNIRYYFEKDLEDVKDEQGNLVIVKDQQGKDVIQKKLKEDFWTKKTTTQN